MQQQEEGDTTDLGRRDFCGAAALAGASFLASSQAIAQESSSASSPPKGERNNFSHCARAWSTSRRPDHGRDIGRYPGPLGRFACLRHGRGRHNPMIEALRKRKSEIQFIGVRHEEAAAFMASGFAKIPAGSAFAWVRLALARYI